jgi:hypothetical protein
MQGLRGQQHVSAWQAKAQVQGVQGTAHEAVEPPEGKFPAHSARSCDQSTLPGDQLEDSKVEKDDVGQLEDASAEKDEKQGVQGTVQEGVEPPEGKFPAHAAKSCDCTT